MRNVLGAIRDAAFGVGIGAGLGLVAWAAGVAYATRSYYTMSEREKQDIIDTDKAIDDTVADIIEELKS